jgi:hypothetical protein
VWEQVPLADRPKRANGTLNNYVEEVLNTKI